MKQLNKVSIKVVNEPVCIPDINSVIATTEKAILKRKEEAYKEVVKRSFEYHIKIVEQIELASKAGISECSINLEDQEVANVLINIYEKEKYIVTYDGSLHLKIKWPDSKFS